MISAGRSSEAVAYLERAASWSWRGPKSRIRCWYERTIESHACLYLPVSSIVSDCGLKRKGCFFGVGRDWEARGKVFPVGFTSLDIDAYKDERKRGPLGIGQVFLFARVSGSSCRQFFDLDIDFP